MDVRCRQWWFTASTMTPQHIWAPPYPKFSRFGPHLHRYNYNSETVHPYAHPQHIMALKYFIYMQIYVTRPILFSDTYYSSVEELVQGQSLVRPSQSLVQSLKQKNSDFGGLVGKEVFIFFQPNFTGIILRAIYRDHIESYLSGFSYSERVQGRFEKMAFFLVDILTEVEDMRQCRGRWLQIQEILSATDLT